MAGGGPSLPNETPPSSARNYRRPSRLSIIGGNQLHVRTEFDLIKCKNQDCEEKREEEWEEEREGDMGTCKHGRGKFNLTRWVQSNLQAKGRGA